MKRYSCSLLKVFFLVSTLSIFVSCSGSGGGSAPNLLIIDFSEVNEDEQLLQEAQANIGLQENSASFYESNKGRWNVTDQEMASAGASGSFTFNSKTELRVDMMGVIEGFGKALIVIQAPYLIEKVPVAGNGFGDFKLYLKTVTCEDFLDKVGDRLICGTAKIQRLEILHQSNNYIQMVDTSDGDELILKR